MPFIFRTAKWGTKELLHKYSNYKCTIDVLKNGKAKTKSRWFDIGKRCLVDVNIDSSIMVDASIIAMQYIYDMNLA